jgi:anti-sigma regulatory factor (Ser/Thr protein kinase)
MSGDAFVPEPGRGAGRAMPASALTPILDQDFDSATLYALRAAVQAHADRAGLSENRINEVVLAVHELAANAIAHGGGRGRLRMWDLPGALSCEVVDGGLANAAAAPGGSEAPDPWPSPPGLSEVPGAAPAPSEAQGAAPAPSEAQGAAPAPSEAQGAAPGLSEAQGAWPAKDGHGLWLVRQVADHLDLRSGRRGTRAVVTFALPRPEDH